MVTKNSSLLITEFMGDYDYNIEGAIPYGDFTNSWDWLMPVVQKIKDTPTYGSTDGIDFVLNCDLTKENLYESVVEFIKTYNLNTSK